MKTFEKMIDYSVIKVQIVSKIQFSFIKYYHLRLITILCMHFPENLSTSLFKAINSGNSHSISRAMIKIQHVIRHSFLELELSWCLNLQKKHVKVSLLFYWLNKENDEIIISHPVTSNFCAPKHVFTYSKNLSKLIYSIFKQINHPYLCYL